MSAAVYWRHLEEAVPSGKRSLARTRTASRPGSQRRIDPQRPHHQRIHPMTLPRYKIRFFHQPGGEWQWRLSNDLHDVVAWGLTHSRKKAIEAAQRAREEFLQEFNERHGRTLLRHAAAGAA